jgi:hypothetical protein
VSDPRHACAPERAGDVARIKAAIPVIDAVPDAVVESLWAGMWRGGWVAPDDAALLTFRGVLERRMERAQAWRKSVAAEATDGLYGRTEGM